MAEEDTIFASGGVAPPGAALKPGEVAAVLSPGLEFYVVPYRYLVIDRCDLDYQATNSVQTALDFSVAEEFFVFDTWTGERLTATGVRIAARSLDEEKPQSED